MRRRLPAALRERDYARLVAAIVAMGFGREMVLVAVGWQVYGISRNPLHLGLVGLAEFLPLPLLALPAGAIADRLSRKLVFMGSLAFDASITALLILVSLSGANSLWPFLALAFASGVAAALGNPAARSMPPTLVPRELLTSALAIRSTVGQATVVTGPALGGLLFAVSRSSSTGSASRSSWSRSRWSRRSGRGPSSRSRCWSPAPASAPCSREPLRPAHAGAARRDHARPLRGPLRRRGRAAAALRARRPARRPVGLGCLRSAPAVGALRPGSC